jgi:hypothetical protein
LTAKLAGTFHWWFSGKPGGMNCFQENQFRLYHHTLKQLAGFSSKNLVDSVSFGEIFIEPYRKFTFALFGGGWGS